MVASLVATPEPDHTPPRVRLDIDTGDDDVLLTDLTITRNGVAIRSQPYAGGREAVAYDYEAPFGVPLEYAAEGTSATFATLYTAAGWPNTSGWTIDSGTVSTTDRPGYVSSASGSALRRSQLFAARRLVIDPRSTPANTALWNLRVGAASITAYPADGLLRASMAGGPTVTIPWTTGPAEVSWTDSQLTVSSDQGRASTSRGGATPASAIQLFLFAGSVVPSFDIMGPTSTPFTATTTTELAVTEAWLIHPSQPSKSVSIDPGAGRWRDDGLNVDRGTAQEKQRAAKRTLHEPYGRKRAVPITTGPRMAATWTLVLYARTLEQRDSVDDLVDDQAPLLLRSPQGWRWDLPDGWYSVDDVTEARPREALIFPDRRITLPLTPTDPPIVSVASLRTWADVLIENETWGDVRDRYETWLDLLTGDVS